MEHSSAFDDLSSYIEENESPDSTVSPRQCIGERLKLAEFVTCKNSTSTTDPDEFIRRLRQAGTSRCRQFQLLRLQIDQDYDSDMTEVLKCKDFDVDSAPPPPPPDGTPPQELPFTSLSNYVIDFSSEKCLHLRQDVR